MKIQIEIDLTNSEVELLKTTDWSKAVPYDSKYNSLITKGVIYEDYAFNLFMTYAFTKIGKILLRNNKLDIIL